MEVFHTEHLTFSYPGQNQHALKDINFTLEGGSFVTLCGVSGCGKTTLLRHLKTVLTPHGRRAGEVYFQGKPLETWEQREQASRIGFVLQSPENQLVTDKVWHELSFGLESLGCSNEVIRLRVAEMASYFGIQDWFYRNVSELSGGQKQLLNLAAVMAMQPAVLLLDEPTSQLDPIAAADFLGTVAKLNRELGLTVLMTEHRLEEALPLSDRVVVMDKGKILVDGTPQEAGEQLGERRHEMFEAMPAPVRIWTGVGDREARCPVTVREGRTWLERYAVTHLITPIPEKIHDTPQTEKAAFQLEEVWFRYEKETPDIVKGLYLSVYPAQICAVLGGNGAGKSTMLSLLSGVNQPDRGRILMEGRPLSDVTARERFSGLLGVLPQNPQALFVKKTVELDLYEMVEERDLSREERDRRVAEVCRLCELESLRGAHPYDLSGGEQQRAALAKVLLTAPRILLLDEPTKGLDAHFKRKLAAILRVLRDRGTAILMVSHDVEFCARYADRCALFFDGSVVAEGEPAAFFTGNSFYTTAANRMSRGVLPDAVTAEDVICACGGEPLEIQTEAVSDTLPPTLVPRPAKPADNPPEEKKRLSKRTVLAAVLVLLLIPATIWFGITFLEDRRYYFISLLVILESMLPFALIFEGKKPQARELVVIAVLCAIGIASRVAFLWVPQFKPVTALVIIAGVAFGGESGFLVGAVTAFASNFYFGQGPWTPWQMFAWGAIGLLAGVLFRKGLLSRSRIVLCIFGGLATLVIYGGIMNASSVLMVQAHPTWEMFAAACLMGLPMDLIHTAATVFFLAAASRPMLDKLDRIKEKYGLLQS